MSSKVLRWVGLLALGTCLFVVAGGCAESRAPINRVQAEALSKHFFVGASLSDPSDDPEFYMGKRLIDEPYGAGFMWQSQGTLNRVKWEIQENVLNARLTYDLVQNSDYYGSQSTNDGQLVAQFTITSHFDIIRDYNTQTGEQLNVIVENTTDRPWYEREYFRVDWSKDLVTDAYGFDSFELLAGIEGITMDNLGYYVEDPSDPNAPVFDTDNGYFDITNKVFVTPQVLSTPYGNLPLCAFYGLGYYPAATCGPSEFTMRYSFRKVVSDDYEPVDWSGTMMNAFGFFEEDRFGYDRNYGIVDQDWHRYATKYNVWQKSHVQGTQCAVDYWRDANGNVQNYATDGNGNYLADPTTGLPIPSAGGQPFTQSCVGCDPHRDGDGDGTEDECQFSDAQGFVVNPGSQCDVATNKCDIPLYARQTTTIPFYYGPTSPPDLYASTSYALNMWNLAIKRAVQLAKVAEAKRIAGSSDVAAPPVAASLVGGVTCSQDGDCQSGGNGNSCAIDATTGKGQCVFTCTSDADCSTAASFATCNTTSGQCTILQSESDLQADQQAGTHVPDILVLCHNPVLATDDAACGASGTVARLGDIRFHMVNVIENPQISSPWGVMTDFNDPLTGEKVQASINVWSAVTDTASQNVEDLLRWVDGEISNTQIANGQYMSQWLSGSQLSTAQYTPKVLTTKEIQSRLNSIDRSIAAQNGLPKGQVLPAPIASTLAASNLAQALGPSMDSQLEGTRTALMGTQWEAQLLTPDILQEAGFNPQQPYAGDPTTLTLASPLRGLDPRVEAWGQSIINNAMKALGTCVLYDDPEPDSLVGLARQAQQLFPAPDPSDPSYPAELYQRDQAMHQWIREQFHTTVIAHEMGHSMGLRHNFTGSFDALNYHTQYWQVRTRNGQEHYCGYPGALDATTPHTNGTDCVGPRWVDPVTDQETNDLVWKWGSTTVMDYVGDYTQEMNDIGNYDKAAMRFAYGGIVDVEQNLTYNEKGGSAGGAGLDFVQALDGFGGIWGNFTGGNHYSTYNDKYSLLGQCTPDPTWTGDPSDPLAQKCSGSSLDYVAMRDMQTVDKYSAQVTATRPDLVGNFAVDKSGRVRHPYMFGSDEFADIGNVPVFRYDAGADSYEQIQFLVSTYENRYIFNNFRRNRTMFNTSYVVNNLTRARYFDKVQQITKSLALGVELLTQPGNDPTTTPGSLMSMALGADDGLAMFVRAMTRPAPGAYVIQNAVPAGVGSLSFTPSSWGGAWQLGDANTDNQPPSPVNVALGNGQGRYNYNDYDYTQGYWWSEYQTKVGSYYEKVLAPMYLTEAYNQFISNSSDDYIDGRYKNLSYMTLYPNQIRRIFANLMATNSATQVNEEGAVAQIFTLAPYSMPAGTTTSNPNPMTQVQYLPWDKYDPTDSTTTSLEYPSGAILLDPLVGWEEQYPALVDLFWFGPTSLNMDLVDLMRIFSPGDAASLSIPDADQVRYRDPVTGIEYVAKNYGTEWVNPAIGFQTAQGIGARMIQHANYLAAIAYQTTGAPDPVTGELTYVTDSNGAPVLNVTAQASQAGSFLTGYASNIDVVRQLTLFFGYGPLGH